MSNEERQQLEAEVARVDRRRAELEAVLGTVSSSCIDYRCQLESELNGLWNLRRTLAEQLRPRRDSAPSLKLASVFACKVSPGEENPNH